MDRVVCLTVVMKLSSLCVAYDDVCCRAYVSKARFEELSVGSSRKVGEVDPCVNLSVVNPSFGEQFVFLVR